MVFREDLGFRKMLTWGWLVGWWFIFYLLVIFEILHSGAAASAASAGWRGGTGEKGARLREI